MRKMAPAGGIAFSPGGRDCRHRPEQRWKGNPLAVATALIFFTCAVHHGSHPVHQLLPAIGLEEHLGLAMREAFDDWHVSSWDVVTAAVGVWYWTLRGRFPALVRSSALFDDVIARERQALEIHDNVVQGLATAKLAFEMDDPQRGMSALDESLVASRKMITDLLGENREGRPLAGNLRRMDAAGGDES
jgi:signal transduction histidine kinase